jgi:hypothetical protein
VYSHPHSASQGIPMGSHRMGHHQIRINIISPRVLEAIVIKIRRQRVGIKVIQSLTIVIIIAGMEKNFAPNMNIVKRGVVIGSTTNLGHGSDKILARRNLNRNLGLPIANIRFVETPQMVSTNLIMITHVNIIME